MAGLPPGSVNIDPSVIALANSLSGQKAAQSSAAIAALAGRPSPAIPSTALTLGGVRFDDDEHPNDITPALSQMYAQLQLIGGGRVVDALGSQPEPITWSGRLTDSRVRPRVQSLYAMVADGQKQRLTFLGFAFIVLVTKFAPKLLHEFECEYEITVEVISTDSGSYASASVTSVDQQITALSKNAVDVATTLAKDQTDAAAAALANAVGPLPQLIASAGPNSPGSAGTAALLARVNGILTIAQTYLGGLTGTNASKLANATQLVNALVLIARNVGAGQSQRSMTVAGANFTSLAAMVYGDASLGLQLAKANNSPALRLSPNVVRTIVFPNFGG